MKHPFDVRASASTRASTRKRTIPESREAELALLARATVTRCPPFAPKESGFVDSPG